MTLPDEALGPGREFDVIREMRSRWGSIAAGIGDDAAVLDVPRGDVLVASNDTSIEGRHFRRGWLTPHEIGYRAVTAALSDLAAMAARPLGVLVALALPAEWQSEVAALADGIGEAAAVAHTRILGGNTSAAGELSLTTTVLGSAFGTLRRDALRPGDQLYVTGRLGGAGAACRALDAGLTPAPADRARFARPVARLTEARWLLDRGATAGIDISDGLAAELQHLAAASGARLEVQLERVPRVDGVSEREAAVSGEEYELLVGAPVSLDARDFERTFGLPLTCIGRAAAGRDVILTSAGARVAIPSGYDHL